MVSRREYLAFALYLAFSFSAADPAAGFGSAARSISDIVSERTAETRELVDALEPDEAAFLGRYALCAAAKPTDIISFTIQTYLGDDPRSDCVDLVR